MAAWSTSVHKLVLLLQVEPVTHSTLPQIQLPMLVAVPSVFAQIVPDLHTEENFSTAFMVMAFDAELKIVYAPPLSKQPDCTLGLLSVENLEPA